MSKQVFTTKQITRIAILASISAILLFINFPIFVFPGFYKIDFSEIPCLLCGFALGPLSGATCVILSRLINIIIEGGSETAYIGELASLIISLSFILVSSFLYKKNHTKKGAIHSLIISTIVTSLVASIVNYFILLPMYETLMNISLDAIISSASKTIPFITNKISFVILCTLPFNLVKGIINSILIVLLYKRISPIIKDIS